MLILVSKQKYVQQNPHTKGHVLTGQIHCWSLPGVCEIKQEKATFAVGKCKKKKKRSGVKWLHV